MKLLTCFDHLPIEELIKLARTCELCELFPEVANFSLLIIKVKKSDLTIEERNMFAYSFKSIVNELRTAYRKVSTELASGGAAESDIEEYKKLLVSQIKCLADIVLTNLTGVILKDLDELLAKASDDKAEKKKLLLSKIFYLRMLADYKRYICELNLENTEEVLKEALDIYTECDETCKKHIDMLEPANSIVMSVYLNFSVFKYELMKDTEGGLDIANSTMANVKEFMKSHADYIPDNDLTMIMRLMTSNIEQWEIEMKHG
eukprot:GAHX01000812.1.p1 GENE.GAHX01000812.1~~GAHX01000812.1.p1  ORF type:complete len:261 (-),score=45.71 GAHX01000812.1:30-812(-)